MDRLAIVQQLGRTYRTFMSAYESYVGHCVPRWRILLRLYEQGEPGAQKQLVETLGMDPGALSRQLKALETLGWIRRSNDPNDNRFTNVSLTPAGVNEVEKNLPRRQDFIQAALGDIPDADQERLMHDLVQLEAHFVRAAKRHTGESAAQDEQ